MNTLQTSRTLAVGDIAPNFALPDEFGRRVVLDGDDVAGHFTVLIFTDGTRAEETQAQLQSFAAAAAAFDGRSVQVFSIARTASLPPGVAWLWPRLADADGQCHAAFLGGAAGGVTTIVLAPNRHVIAVLNGREAQAERALAAIEQAAALRRPAMVNTPHPPVLIVPDVLSPADCQYLMRVFAEQGEFVAQTQHGAAMPARDYKVRVPEYGRRDRIDHFIINADTSELIHSRFRTRLFPEIKKAYQYEITRYEPYRIGCYEGERGGELHGHRDNTLPMVAHRRFAVSVNLNSHEFEGGELRFPEFGDEVYRPESGAAIAFSCSMLHEAMHVTRGRRLVLLAFLGGEH
jgi:predicted 2-oxoglutarate/Fe(II)-dependent dioxygenase YbiX